MTSLHRVAWVDPDWESLDAAAPFHPLHVPVDRQGQGRFDNPHLYVALYAAATPQAAVGETFGNLARWPAEEITREKEGRPRCLVDLEVDDATTLVDLDDAGQLGRLGIKPSDVVRRNRSHTQEVAKAVWRARTESAARGLRWWSYWRPEWTVAVLWSDGLEPPYFPAVRVVGIERLHPAHQAVQVAADVLPRLVA